MLLNEFNEPNELLQTQAYVGFKWTYGDGASYINGRGGFRDETSTNLNESVVRDGVPGTLTNQWLQARTIGDIDVVGSGLRRRQLAAHHAGQRVPHDRVGVIEAGNAGQRYRVERPDSGVTLEWGYDTADESRPTLSTEDLNMFLAAHQGDERTPR